MELPCYRADLTRNGRVFLQLTSCLCQRISTSSKEQPSQKHGSQPSSCSGWLIQKQEIMWLFMLLQVALELQPSSWESCWVLMFTVLYRMKKKGRSVASWAQRVSFTIATIPTGPRISSHSKEDFSALSWTALGQTTTSLPSSCWTSMENGSFSASSLASKQT